MKVIGITGNSGTGKTSFTKLLTELQNIKVIDADIVVREMSVPGTAYVNAIREKIGEDVFEKDGNLNRKLLASRIYDNKEDLEKLNNLTFKYIVQEIKNRVTKIKEADIHATVIIDAPLLFESGLDKICDYTIALIADKEIKIERICKRDNITKEIASSRLNIQPNDEFYTKQADFIIVNNGKENSKEKAQEILKNIN